MDGATTYFRAQQWLKIHLALLLFSIGIPSGLAQTSEIRVGDVILIELNCYICRAISQATKSSYNHSGLVVEINEKGPIIAQSLMKVEVLELGQFLNQSKKNSMQAHLRPRELARLYETSPQIYQNRTDLMAQNFKDQFLGKPFDAAYLWTNILPTGEEPLYCSEMVQKTLNTILEKPIQTVLMDFTAGYEYWDSYFDGKVPQDQEGNSPSSLYHAPEIQVVDEGEKIFLR
jgi:hypothetical protein